MPVPSSIGDLSTTPASNSPAGSETPSSVDDYLRTLSAFIKQIAVGSHTWCGAAGGTANALTLTPPGAISAYAAGEAFRFQASLTNTGATTVAISGLTPIAVQTLGAPCAGGEIIAGQWYELILSSASVAQLRTTEAPNRLNAMNMKRATVAATATTTPLWNNANGNIQDWTGTPTVTDFPAAPQAGAQREVYPVAGTIITHGGNISVQGNASYTVAAGDKLVINAVTVSTFAVEVVRKNGSSVSAASKIQTISASVAANALTITANPTSLDFRSATLSSGAVNTRTISSAISTVISSGSTGGTVSAAPSRLIVLAIDNAGTVELAWANAGGGVNFDESTLISTVAEGGAGAADSANVIYSTTARSNVPFRILGYIDSTQTVAGTWAAAPSAIQGAGGQSSLSKASQITMGAPQASTSGTAIDFTGIPAWAKRVNIMLSGVSTNGGSGIALQLGDAGGIETTGYVGSATSVSTSVGTPIYSTTYIPLTIVTTAADLYSGVIHLDLMDITQNTWIAEGVMTRHTTAQNLTICSNKSLSSVLDRIRVTSINGTDTFDAGSINISFE